MPVPEALPGAPPAGERRAVPCEGPGCGRLLTDVLSRSLRRGPECRTAEFAARSFDAAQDVLPGLDVTPGR